MLRINKKVEYALMALKFMSTKDDGELTSAREIYERFNIPYDTTAKVMQTMNLANILNSVQGIKGGYTLKSDLSNVSFMELVRLVEGDSEKGSVCKAQKKCGCGLQESCNIMGPINKLNKKVNYYLESLTIKELLSGEINGAAG
ncbi:MAG: Rrf2 family transcriptional regulator [Bacteriovoracaceae bacterium]|nr:Rrf2 family transcriptional regulator [Bacteriovoracaceae bacterium]